VVGKLSRAAVITAALGVMAPGSAAGAEILTTTTADEISTNGTCSLREAVLAANTDTAVDACPPGSGEDTIRLGADEYRLTIGGANEDGSASGDLDLRPPATLAGVAGRTAIVGDGTDRVLQVHGGPAMIEGLRITGGQAVEDPATGAAMGGGILFEVGLESDAVESRLHQVTVADNEADQGGGIASHYARSGSNPPTYFDVVRIEESAILDNVAIEDGGGLWPGLARFEVNSSLIDGNAAGTTGGGVAMGGVFLLSSTVSDNEAGESGGGIQGFAANAQATIVAGNRAPNQPDCSSVISGGWNLFGTVGCVSLNQAPGTDLSGVDPQLLPRDTTLGPTTVRPIPASSPANDRITDFDYFYGCWRIDQRGYERGDVDRGVRCDVGAFEYVTCEGEVPTIAGTLKRDRIVGTPGPDVITAFSGNDTVTASGGDDVICSGSGEDSIDAGSGADLLLAGPSADDAGGGKGDDRLISGEGADTSDGGAGDDRLLGTSGQDALRGKAGNDKLVGGPKRDRCLGGPGRNVVIGCEQRPR
jgi:CSLREA domain-containing protein